MPKTIVGIECGEKDCGVCELLEYSPHFQAYFCTKFEPRNYEYLTRKDALRLPACLAGEKQLADLVEAAWAVLRLMGREKALYEDHPDWDNLRAALAPFEEKP